MSESICFTNTNPYWNYFREVLNLASLHYLLFQDFGNYDLFKDNLSLYSE